MAALSAGRKDLDNAGQLIQTLGRPAAASKTFYANGMVALSGGYLQPVTGTFGEQVVGVSDLTLADNVVSNAVAGVTKIVTKTGIFPFLIGTSADVLAQTDVGSRVYAIDDQTVGKTDGGVRRPIAGQLVFVETLGSVTRAYVAIGFETPDLSLLQAAGGLGQAPDAIGATGTLSLLDTTLATVSGTCVYTLPNGTVLGQRKRVIVISAVSTPVGSIVVTTPRGFATITAIGTLARYEFQWTATGWLLVSNFGGTVA